MRLWKHWGKLKQFLVNMDDLYRDEILDHYKHPRNVGSVEEVPVGAQVLHIHVSNQGCGDEIDADLLIQEGKVIELKWRGTGCAISQASMSMMSEWAIGKTTQELSKLSKNEVLSFVGLPEIVHAREKCALLPLQVCAHGSLQIHPSHS